VKPRQTLTRMASWCAKFRIQDFNDKKWGTDYSSAMSGKIDRRLIG
jgi:hypothetical protein